MTGIIFNPTARGDKATRFRRDLADLGSEARLVPTRCAGDARLLAAELSAAGFNTLVAAGGDGTVNEVLNGICDTPEGLERTRLGVIPLGTVNVFAKELGIPAGVAGAWRVVRSGHERRVDLPCAEFRGVDGKPERRHFALMAGAGLDSRAIALVDWEHKKRIGPLAYVWAGIRAMRPPHPQVRVTLGEITRVVELAEIGNGRLYGGRFPVFPRARLDDGRLDVTLFPRVTWPRVAAVFARLLLNRLEGSPDALLLQSETLTLAAETAASEVPFHLDGDVVGTLPARISVQPRRLRVATDATRG
ncbi:MAG: diacylglycerol kinase family lipid kinase [Verrucomicrobia bacterium]|nr:diacylglycerol kinase family lipid kinase [Verrucomicrobiota bacterium]